MKIFLFNICNSLRNNRIIFIAAGLLFFFAFIKYTSPATQYINIRTNSSITSSTHKITSDKLSSADYLLSVFHGMYEIDDISDTDLINFPLMYTGLALIFTLITSSFAASDINKIIICKYRSRIRWLVSKIAAVLINLFILIISYVLLCVIAGGNRWDYHEGVNRYMFDVSFCKMTGTDIVAGIILVITSVYAISMLQIAITIIFNNITGIFISLIIYLMSMFNSNILLLGNGTMLQRSSFFMENGYDLMTVLMLNIIVIIISIVVMNIYIKRWNII